jgi:hypothetical protein
LEDIGVHSLIDEHFLRQVIVTEALLEPKKALVLSTALKNNEMPNQVIKLVL